MCDFSWWCVCVYFRTDQDHDGSHIKGLIINMFSHFWPSLLKLPGFLTEFITPIVVEIMRAVWEGGSRSCESFFVCCYFCNCLGGFQGQDGNSVLHNPWIWNLEGRKQWRKRMENQILQRFKIKFLSHNEANLLFDNFCKVWEQARLQRF